MYLSQMMEKSNMFHKDILMRNNDELSKKVSLLIKQSEEISILLKKIEELLKQKDPYFKDNLIEKALCKMEKSVLDFRNIVPYFPRKYSIVPNISKPLQENYSQNYQIEISKNEIGYRIILPLTLPKFGEKKKSILIEPLNFALKKYALNNKIFQLKSAVFAVINHISSNTSMYLIKDNDNYEYKDIINTLSFWFLPDDSFDCCNLYSETRISNDNFTEIFIIPTENFADFYLKHLQNLS